MYRHKQCIINEEKLSCVHHTVLNDTMGISRIGTSGIVLAGLKQSFPVEFQNASRLHYYSHLFNTVEINSTFYNLPIASTLEKWYCEVNEHFCFTFKVPKIITHCKSLIYREEDIISFMDVASHIGKRKVAC